MASGSVYIDARLKDEDGNTVVFGRALLGNKATINPRDLGLRYIRNVVITPWHTPGRPMGQGSIGSLASIDYSRGFASVSGSLGSLGVLDTSTGSAAPIGNYVHIRAYRMRTLGSLTMRAAAAQGTRGLYIGTQAGSLRHSFIAIGA